MKVLFKKKSNKKHLIDLNLKVKNRLQTNEKINKNQLFILTQITYHLSFTKEDILPAFKFFELFFFKL